MKKLDRFILGGFLGPFFAILLLVVFILMLQFLWVYIDELVGKGLSFRVIMEFMLWGACTTMPTSLPLATLLSSMMTMGQLAENNELMAMKSSGISLGRIMLPIMVASFFIAIGAFFVSNNLVPKAYEEIYTLRDDIGRTKNEIKIPAGTFYDGIDGYILRVKEQDKADGTLRGVMVYDHTGSKANTSLSLADSAVIKMSRNKDYLIFTMYSGVNYTETNTRKYREESHELQHIHFDRQDLVIPLEHYSFEKSDTSRFGDQARAMKAEQLRERHDSLTRITTEAHDRQYRAMRLSSMFTMYSQLDTAVKKSSDRPLFEAEGFLSWDDPEKEMQACQRAEQRAMQMVTTMKGNESEIYEYVYVLRRTDIEWLKKYAMALACFVLFFIGAPLGSVIRKGGLGTSAIVSVLFFVLYWVVDITGTKLARDGAISAPVGAFIASAVLLPIGVFLTSRAVHDATFFDSDRMKSWWRRITSIIGRFFKPRRIVFMGTPEFAVASLDALIRERYKVVAVVTVADKPMGRGLRIQESAVKKYAVEHGIPVMQPTRLKDPEFLKELASYKADLFVVVAFRMLPEEVWGMPRMGTFNLHASLLPQYRGAAPVNWAVMNGERLTGVTTFMLDRNIDTGGIILRQECRIRPDDTAGTLHDKLMAIGADLVVATTEGIFQRNVETRVQKSFIQGSEVLHAAPKLTRENTRIDWSAPAGKIYNFVRGLSPYPSAWTTLVDAEGVSADCKVFFGEVAGGPAGEPGTISSDGKTFLSVATGEGSFRITELQLAGKKRMGVEDFLRGFRDPETCRMV